MAPGHRTSEAIGYAILILLAFLLPVFGGLIAFIVSLARKSKAAAALSPDELAPAHELTR